MKIAVIGLGSIGRRHAANFTALGCEVSTFDPQYGGTLSTALQGADGVVIATPPDSHVDLAYQALDAGCHVMIEKPLALGRWQVPLLLRDCDLAKRVVMVAYPWRYDRSMREKRRRVLEDIGPVHDWSCWYGYDTGNATARSMGALFDCSHAIDFLRWLMGPPASLACRLSPNWLVADLDMRFTQGGTGCAHLDLTEPIRCEWSITGEHGTVDWIRSRDVDYDINDTYVTEAAHFLSCVRGEAIPATDGWDGLETLKVALAAVQASQEGSWRAIR